MSGTQTSAAEVVDRAYRSSDGEVAFAQLAAQVDVDADDDALAELIEADGRQRIARGLPVPLSRYIDAAADLQARTVPLDAAIDVALRSLSRGSLILSSAVEALVQTHPQLESVIRDAAALGAAVLSTTGLQRQLQSAPARPLPADFGPRLASGQHRYVLEEVLGHGAFGHVYLGTDRQLSEEGHTARVAIKILVQAERTPFDRQRLIEEATKVRRISHPNVVMVLDRGVSDDNEDFIVYEYVDGGDLDERSGANPTAWPPRDAAALMAKVARGIHAAHSAGVIHCDLKPGNIMMTQAGEPKVTDFGVAVRIGESRPANGAGPKAAGDRPIGNIAFISPEQFLGEADAISVQADVYALGGILFYVLTGILPNGSTFNEIARRHSIPVNQQKPPSIRRLLPKIDSDLESIVSRALAPQADQRYASAAAFEEDLQRWLSREPLIWNAPGFGRVLKLWIRRKPALAAAVAAIFGLLVAGIVVSQHFAKLARQRELDAAIAEARVDEQQRAKQQQDANRVALMNRLVSLQQNYRYNTDILPQIWYLEYMLGPKVLDIPEAQSRLWEMRIQTIRWFVDDAHKHGRGTAMETLLWESALGFWLVGSGDHAEAEPLLKRTIEAWRAKLDPEDQWLADVETLLMCATVNRLVASAKNDSTRNSRARVVEEATVVRAALLKAEQEFPDDHRGTPLHLLVLDRLADVHGEALLNEPAKVEQLNAERAALVKKR